MPRIGAFVFRFDFEFGEFNVTDRQAPGCVREEARDIPVYADADVLVVGGGIAGCAAAVAAGRAGARTILVERNGCLGGVATATMMQNIGNRFFVTDRGRVIEGIAAEVVDRLEAVGAASPHWRKHKAVAMDAERLKVVLIEMLEQAGVETLTHSMAAMPMMDGRAVIGCFFESKSGRMAIPAKNTVDCTGEADVAYRAGAEVNEHRFSSSLLYKLARVDIDRFVDFVAQDPDAFPDGKDWIKDCDEFKTSWREDGVLFFGHHAGRVWAPLQEMARRARFGDECVNRGHDQRWWGIAENIDAFGMYTHRNDGTLVINTGYYCMDTINVRDLSAAELHAQKLCYYTADFLKENVPGFENCYVEHIGVDLGLRGGRYITGRSRLKEADFHDAPEDSHCDDVIATAPMSTKRQGLRPGELGRTTDIPFGSCVPVNVGRLLVGSGKSVDAEGGNSRIYRGMSGCMVYGQATGVAAAVAARQGVVAEDLAIRDLQAELLKQGVRLGDEERLAELGLR